MVYWQTMIEEFHIGNEDGNVADSSAGGAFSSSQNYGGQQTASVSSYGLSTSVASGMGGAGTSAVVSL